MTRRIRSVVIMPDNPDDPSGLDIALARANVPPRYRRATLRDALLRNPRGVRAAGIGGLSLEDELASAAWLREGRGYFLHGPLGTGKSSIAGILIRDAVQRCERACWLAVREVPSVAFRDSSVPPELIDQALAADVLVLDDLGAEGFKMDGPAGAALEGVIRRIYDREGSLVISSNIHWDVFKSTYPAPVVSVVERCTRPLEVRGG